MKAYNLLGDNKYSCLLFLYFCFEHHKSNLEQDEEAAYFKVYVERELKLKTINFQDIYGTVFLWDFFLLARADPGAVTQDRNE